MYWCETLLRYDNPIILKQIFFKTLIIIKIILNCVKRITSLRKSLNLVKTTDKDSLKFSIFKTFISVKITLKVVNKCSIKSRAR